MEITLRKKHIYVIIGLLILFLGIFIINAAVIKTKAWHSANDILVTISGYTMTLQEAIDNNVFIDGATQSYTTEIPDPGHGADKIWVSVDGSEMTLQNAISTIGLCGSSSHSYTGSINPGHFASEIEVLIDGSYMSLQEAIDSEEFCCVPETCAGLGYNCGIWDDGCGGILDCGTCGSYASCPSGTCVCNAGWADCNNDNSCECDLSSHYCSGTSCLARLLQDWALGGTVTTTKSAYVDYIHNTGKVKDGDDNTADAARASWSWGKFASATYSWIVTLPSAKDLETIEFITLFSGSSFTNYPKTEFWLEYYDGSWHTLYYHPLTKKWIEGKTIRTYSAGYPDVSKIRIRVNVDGYSGSNWFHQDTGVYSMKMIGY